MTENERTVQVPVSRIRDTVDSAMQKHGYGILLPLQDQEFTAVVEDVTAAVTALLSQPNPTAEPTCTCGHAMDERDLSETGECQVAIPWCVCTKATDAAEPTRIEDMAPGTRAALERADLVLGGFVQHDWASSISVGEWYLGELRKLRDAIDPSTIRDVTPPKGSDRG